MYNNTAACHRWRQRFPEKWEAYNRERNWKRNYGMTPEQYHKMPESQGGVCAVCGTDKPDKKRKFFSVDHCHKTGAIRGLLCTNCNFILGHSFDSVELLEKSIAYLKKGSVL